MSIINRGVITGLVIAASYLSAFPSFAEGGISIQGTRIIYAINSKQEAVPVSNTSATDSFLVQSWAEDAAGNKTKDFVVTPPLYLSGPKNENILRLLRVGGTLPQDRESLYYFVVKAIPSVERDSEITKSVLRISTASRIKLFVRPAGLASGAEQAPDNLTFKQVGNNLDIYNPTPYYITMTKIVCGTANFQDIMIAPKSHATEPLKTASSRTITFSTINDYGAVTPAHTKDIQ